MYICEAILCFFICLLHVMLNYYRIFCCVVYFEISLE